MPEKSIRLLLSPALLALLVCASLLASLSMAGAAPPPAPQLSVSAGSATATATKVKGSVTFHNAGPDAGGRFYFTLVVKLSGPDRLLKRAHQAELPPSKSRSIGFSVKVPGDLPAGRDPVWACAAESSAPPEPSAKNGCRALTTIEVPAPKTSAPAAGGGSPPSSSPPASPPSSGSPAPAPGPPVSTVPTAPLAFTAEEPFVVNDANNGYYWADVPAAYDASNQTPTPLLVWLHGCGGESSGDIYTVSPETVGTDQRPRDWISIAVGGRDDDCWDVNNDEPAVFAAIADVETHFNIDRHRVILGGYSSGGDLSYRLAFDHSDQFAGVLAENTGPFQETGLTESQSLAEATYKFHVVHLAHLEDDAYKIENVRRETDAMKAAGFPLELIERKGGHADSHTDPDLIELVLPHIDDGWRSP